MGTDQLPTRIVIFRTLVGSGSGRRIKTHSGFQVYDISLSCGHKCQLTALTIPLETRCPECTEVKTKEIREAFVTVGKYTGPIQKIGSGAVLRIATPQKLLTWGA